MSYSIYYKSMFVKLSDGRYIPMMEAGDSNTYDGQKRCRDWQLRRPIMQEGEARYGRYAFTREEIMGDLEAFIDSEKASNVNQPKNRWDEKCNEYWTYKDIEKKFSYFSGMTIYGASGYTSAQQIRNFFLKGFERAIDMEAGVLEMTYWLGGYGGEYKREFIESEEHLARRWQELREGGTKEIYLDFTIHAMLRYDQQDRKAKKPSARRQQGMGTMSISLRNAEKEPERVMNYRDYEQEAKVGDRIILDGTGIISGFANATRSRTYKVVGRNDDGLLLTQYGCSKRLYVQDYYKDQKVGILTAQEFAALPY